MQPQFLNNFRSTLASGIASGDTTIVLNDMSRIPTTVSADRPLFLTLVPAAVDLPPLSDVEIVKATGVTTDANGNVTDLTVARGQEDTTAKSFNADDNVSQRYTAGIASQSVRTVPFEEQLAVNSNANPSAMWLVSSPYSGGATGYYAIALGDGAYAQGNASIAGGGSMYAVGSYTIAFGYNSQNEGNYSLVLGIASHVYRNTSLAVGDSCVAYARRTMARGCGSRAEAINTYAGGEYSIAAGDNARAQGGGDRAPTFWADAGQHVLQPFDGHTTDGTTTEAAGGELYVGASQDSIVAFQGRVVATAQNGYKAAWKIEGMAHNTGSGLQFNGDAVTQIAYTGTANNWSVSLVANNGYRVEPQLTGESGADILWAGYFTASNVYVK